MDSFVNENYPGEIADCYNKLNIIVAKVDFWRYLVLYKYGGVYLDIDSSIDYPLRNLIRDNDEAIITAETNPELYVQWALIFSKNHPILKKAIELVVDNIKTRRYPHDVHKTTGPTVYSKAINEVHKELFGIELQYRFIQYDTDITFIKNNISYRLFSFDYNRLFTCKHNAASYLYKNKIHWLDEQKEKSVIKT